MPKQAKAAPPKRTRLTLGQLASYDDLLTDCFVDNAFYWCTIRKNRSKYTPCRRFRKDDIRTILFEDVICKKDLKKAEQRFSQLSGIQNYTRSLKTDGEREHFKRHMRKYINIWTPDCAWEVGTTNRYTILTPEAAVYARRKIKKGETIKYLCGTLVVMTPEEEKDLDVTRRDFSIVRSSRRKASALFLGPARFSNHDCNANASLTTTGSDGMNVVAVRNIDIGEEITVTYGEDYFGEDNCECLCHSCELKARNGWTGDEAEQGAAIPVPAVVEDTAPYRFRNKRKRSAETDSPSVQATPEIEVQTPHKRMKKTTPIIPRASSLVRAIRSVYGKRPNQGCRRSTRSSYFKDGSIWDQELDSEPMEDVQSSPLKNEIKHEVDEEQAAEMSRVPSSQTSNEPSDLDPVFDHQEEAAEEQAPTPESSGSEEIVVRAGASKQETTESTPQATAEQHEQESGAHVEVKQEEVADDMRPEETYRGIREASEVSIDEVVLIPDSSSATAKSDGRLPTPDTSILPEQNTATLTEIVKHAVAKDPIIGVATPMETAETESELSDIASDEELDEKTQRLVKRSLQPLPPPRRRRGRPPGRKSSPSVIPSIEEPRPGRRPGDYQRTKELLAQAGSMWADCHTCDGTWVQVDSHETHRECPRCERHSIMFGYEWPKTEQDDGDEDRVKDHRTINRILAPEAQRGLKRRGRGLEGTPASMPGSARASTGPADELKVVEDGRRRSKRRSCS